MTMTAADIIALLREHPVCCGRLGIEVYPVGSQWRASSENGRMSLWGDSKDEFISKFRRWLTGACVEWCITNGVMLPEQCFAEWDIHDADGNTTRYPTFLHALLAAIERHEEMTNA